MSYFFSAEKSELFRGSTEHLSRAEVILDGEVYDDTFYNSQNLRLVANESRVNYDRLREARSSASLTMLALNNEAREALDPVNAAKVCLYSGVRAGGDVEWAPLGMFRVHSSDDSEYQGVWEYKLGCTDLSEVLRENVWKQPFKTGGGTYKAAIEAILADRGSSVDHTLWLYEYTADNAPDLHYLEDDDPWTAVYNLAISSESEIYFAKNGWIVVEQVPDPSADTPVYLLGGGDFKVEEGRRRRRISRRDIYNGVICRSEAPWLLFPVSGEYWDDDPASETYRLGPFGERPKVIGSPIAVDAAHCASIAESEFRRVAGVSEEVTFQSFKDPYLDVGATIEVEGSKEGPEFYTLDLLDYPLGSSAMRGTVRRKRF